MQRLCTARVFSVGFLLTWLNSEVESLLELPGFDGKSKPSNRCEI